MSDNIVAIGVPADSWKIDLSVARGLGYYTGPVFETILDDLPSIGSVFSGGRYDDLVSRFGDRSVAATGASVGVDRLFAAMEKLDLVKKEKATAKVVVLNFDQTAETYCQEVVSTIRKEPDRLCPGTRRSSHHNRRRLRKGKKDYSDQERPNKVSDRSSV
jgi:histidyl-tRNA synthetase